MQLRFASLAVISLRRDLHPQECARAGRTTKKAAYLATRGFRRRGRADDCAGRMSRAYFWAALALSLVTGVGVSSGVPGVVSITSAVTAAALPP